MSNHLRLTIFLLLQIAFLSTSVAKAPKESPYFIKTKDSKVLSFKPSKIQLFTNAVFFNTYNNKAKLTDVNIDVYIDNHYLGKVENTQDVKIPKLNTFDIPLYLSIEPTTNLLYNSLLNSAKLTIRKKVEVKYTGYIKIKVIGFIPITIRLDDKVEYSLY